MRTRTTRPPELVGLPGRSVRVVDHPLQASGALAACTRDELRRLARVGDIVVADAGVMVQPACRPLWVYFVLDGMLAVTCDDETYVVGTGELVGARAALTGRQAVVGIESLVPCRFFVVASRRFQALMRQHAGLAFGVARHLADGTGMA